MRKIYHVCPKSHTIKSKFVVTTTVLFVLYKKRYWASDLFLYSSLSCAKRSLYATTYKDVEGGLLCCYRQKMNSRKELSLIERIDLKYIDAQTVVTICCSWSEVSNFNFKLLCACLMKTSFRCLRTLVVEQRFGLETVLYSYKVRNERTKTFRCKFHKEHFYQSGTTTKRKQL